MPVLNLPPAMMGQGGPMGAAMGGAPMGAPLGAPNPMQAALASVLMPRQQGFPPGQAMRIPKPPHKKLRGKMSKVTAAAIKAKVKRSLGGL